MSSAVTPSPGSVKAAKPRRVVRQSIPDSVLLNPELNKAIAESLPPNYSFEIHKTVWRIQQLKARTIALQFPEGLLMYAMTLADLLEEFAGVEHCIILGDVAYGACCIDDITASLLGAELLVHYGHSCLVPVNNTCVPCLYVFVGIAIDTPHLTATIQRNFPKFTILVVAGTIQFSSVVQQAVAQLKQEGRNVLVPQVKPLSAGEVLGCTAPKVRAKEVMGKSPDTGVPTKAEVDEEDTALIFVADGRFHMEAMMIANPELPAFRYDPFTRKLLRERYDHVGMRASRRAAIERAFDARRWGIVLGTLGRQGNTKTLDYVQAILTEAGRELTVFLVSELSPAKVSLFEGEIDAWVQIACPRLSIDWGDVFSAPLLTSFEVSVALGKVQPWWADGGGKEGQASYPMDYYASGGGGWNGSYISNVRAQKIKDSS